MISTPKRVMTMAHILYDSFPLRPRGWAGPEFKTWPDALSYAWYFERFRKTLRNGIVHFTYRKEDDSYREATGTCFPWLIPSENQPKTSDSERKPKLSTIIYYDIDAKGWRSFDIRRFIGFVNVYQISRVEGQALRNMTEVKPAIEKSHHKH
jgi:hypothetical protein